MFSRVALGRNKSIKGKRCLKRDDTWKNNKRLESHGLALRTFCDFLLQKLAKGTRKTKEHAICRAIASLGLYFQAIDYPTAPSAGTWEEIPLPYGLSWDTEAIRQGFVALKELMFGNNDTVVEEYRNAIRQSARDLAFLTEQTNSDLLFKEEKVLDELIQMGSRKICARVRRKAEAPDMRPHDASLAFLAQSDLSLIDERDSHECIIETARLYIELLDILESSLVRENGMIRYEPFVYGPGEEPILDSYLNVNYWLSFDEEGYFNPKKARLIKKFESSDTSDIEKLRERNQFGIREREAEWFLVTEMARGYTKQAERLYDSVFFQQASENQRQKALEMFEKCKDKACEYLKRGYARITPSQPGDSEAVAIKANGECCPLWGIPEAYEWVRIRASATKTGENSFSERILPGANTSLAWATASLKRATEEVLSLYEKIE